MYERNPPSEGFRKRTGCDEVSKRLAWFSLKLVLGFGRFRYTSKMHLSGCTSFVPITKYTKLGRLLSTKFICKNFARPRDAGVDISIREIQ